MRSLCGVPVKIVPEWRRLSWSERWRSRPWRPWRRRVRTMGKGAAFSVDGTLVMAQSTFDAQAVALEQAERIRAAIAEQYKRFIGGPRCARCGCVQPVVTATYVPPQGDVIMQWLCGDCVVRWVDEHRRCPRERVGVVAGLLRLEDVSSNPNPKGN